MTPAQTVLAACQALHAATPALTAFAPPPTITSAPVAVTTPPIPAAHLVARSTPPGSAATAPVVKSFAAAAPCLPWKQTYTEAEVGARFLATYGYVELYGPDGLFLHATARAYLAYWGPGLNYDWHVHEAEELYFCLAGQALFRAEGVPDLNLTPGAHRIHTSRQPHAMTTGTEPFLAFVLWRGAGLNGLPSLLPAGPAP